MERFSKRNFDRAGEAREALCTDLASALTGELRRRQGFHHAVYALISELRKLGHDLTSYDEADETQVWGPDYVVPSGPGLVITFTAPDDVGVEWSPQ